MRPLVRSEQLRLRMPKDIKNAIVNRAGELNISQTAYVEMLVRRDNDLLIENESIEKREQVQQG